MRKCGDSRRAPCVDGTQGSGLCPFLGVISGAGIDRDGYIKLDGHFSLVGDLCMHDKHFTSQS